MKSSLIPAYSVIIRRTCRPQPWLSIRVAFTQNPEDFIADARQLMHMLMPVDMIGRATQPCFESVKLGMDFGAKRRRVKIVQVRKQYQPGQFVSGCLFHWMLRKIKMQSNVDCPGIQVPQFMAALLP